MQRALGASLAQLRSDWENKHESLKNESKVIQMWAGVESETPSNQIGKKLGELWKTDLSPSQRIRLAKFMLDLATTADAKTAEHDLAGFDFEDLKAALFESAKDQLLKDEGFFLSVVYQVLQEKPYLLEEIQGNTSRLIEVKVTDGP